MAWQTCMNRSSRAAVDKLVLVAKIGDPHPADQFHDKVRPAVPGGAGVKHLGDVRVVHQRQGLALGFETRDDRACIHAELDDFESDAATDRFFLLRQIHDAAAALADFFQELVPANALAGVVAQLIGQRVRFCQAMKRGGWVLKKISRVLGSPEKTLNPREQSGVISTPLCEISSTSLWIDDRQRLGEKNLFCGWSGHCHTMRYLTAKELTTRTK